MNATEFAWKSTSAHRGSGAVAWTLGPRGGLPRALGLINQANALFRFIHPGMFGLYGQRQPDGGVFSSGTDPGARQWKTYGAEPIVTRDPQTCLEGLFLIIGEIPRITAMKKVPLISSADR